MATINDHLSPYNVKQHVPYAPPLQVITADGAINIAAGVVFLEKSSAAAVTIANPPLDMDGCELVIIATTAQAHTVTYATTGFNGGGTGTDVATYGGAKGDNLHIVARAGVWYVISLVNVTLA